MIKKRLIAFWIKNTICSKSSKSEDDSDALMSGKSVRFSKDGLDLELMMISVGFNLTRNSD